MKRKFQNILMLVLSAMLLSSCLKDETIIGPDSPGSAGAIIEFANPDYIVSGSLTSTVKLARYAVTVTRGTSSKVNLRVNYAGTGKGAPEDVVVNLTSIAASLDTHNAQGGRTIAFNDPDPTKTPNMFTLIAGATFPATVTIPKGAEGVDFAMTINTSGFLTDTKHKSLYAIPLKISSASSGTISGNFGEIIINVLAP